MAWRRALAKDHSLRSKQSFFSSIPSSILHDSIFKRSFKISEQDIHHIHPTFESNEGSSKVDPDAATADFHREKADKKPHNLLRELSLHSLPHSRH